MSFQLSPENEQQLSDILERYPTSRAACIPLLQLCQEQEGWMSPEVIDYVANRLDMSAAAVKGVATFYTSLHDRPVGKHVVWVCRTLSCELRGAADVQERLERYAGCKMGETSADGSFTLKKAECLAGCGYAPVLQIDDCYFENILPEEVEGLLQRIKEGRVATRIKRDGAGWAEGAGDITQVIGE